MIAHRSGGDGDARRWAQLEELFAAALDTPPEQRDALLESGCADASLRAEVRRLLERHEVLASSSGPSEGFLAPLDLDRAARLFDTASSAAGPRSIGRYEVVRRLGRGATGVVYLARDPLLEREAAVKLLSADLSADRVGALRFEQEARAASALDHPRVVTIYEIGRTDDERLFFAMAYHEGTTLRERIAEGPLPIDAAVRIASEIAEGLSAAHTARIIHRDIKPENVLLTARGACILDFGIAKIAGESLTRTGAALGTAAYMSPEQTRGAGVDERTDLWSLGVVLYEMLTGERPFRSAGGEALVYSVRHDPAVAVDVKRPAIPRALAAIVGRCLEKDPARRYASASEVLHALRSAATTPDRRVRGGRRWIAAAIALVAIGAAGAVVASRREHVTGAATARAITTTPSSGRVRAIAFMPFASVGDAGKQGYLTEGMTSEVMLQLASVPQLRVADPVALLIASKDGADVRTIAARLGTTSLLRGSVRHADGRMLVAAELLESEQGKTLWSRSYDRSPGDALAIAEDIRHEVVAALGIGKPAQVAQRATSHARPDPRAYDLYLRGRFAYDQRTAAGLAEAGVYFREAIAHDSTFARAYIGLADVLSAAQDSRPDERFRRAKPLVARALALDSTLAVAHRSAGWIAMWYDHDWTAAERHLRRALALDPSDIWMYHGLAAYLSAVGRTDESLALTRQATAIDPVSSATATHIGLHLFWSRRYAESIAVLEHALTIDTTWKRTHVVLGRAYLAVGRYDDAIRALRRTGYEFAAFSPEAVLAYGLGVAGHTAEAREITDRLEARARGTYVRPVDLVAAHLGLGDTARALDWADRIPDDRGSMIFVFSEPMYDPIRDTPRFRRVVERLGLGDAARRIAVRDSARARVVR
jgi:eukaryotic-like serine/threonine-protein kinase